MESREIQTGAATSSFFSSYFVFHFNKFLSFSSFFLVQLLSPLLLSFFFLSLHQISLVFLSSLFNSYLLFSLLVSFFLLFSYFSCSTPLSSSYLLFSFTSPNLSHFFLSSLLNSYLLFSLLGSFSCFPLSFLFVLLFFSVFFPLLYFCALGSTMGA